MPRSEQFQSKFQVLQDNYITNLPKKLDTIDNCWSMLNNINWDIDRLYQLQMAVHQMAGSAGNFGLKELSEHAKTLDEILSEFIKFEKMPNSDQKDQANTCINKMLESVGVVHEEEHDGLSNNHVGTKILIIDDDDDQAQILKLLCEELGCVATTTNTLKSAPDQILDDVPDLILLIQSDS